MRIKSSIICYFIFLIILNIVNAQENQNLCGTNENPCGDNWKNFDYSNPSAKISSIPPEQIDIGQVIANNRGDELTKDQIKANFDKIDNLNEVDSSKAKQAIAEKYGVTVESFGESASIKNGILKANFGKEDKISISNDVYRNGFLEITEEGEIVFVPDEKTTKLDIPKGDSPIVESFQNTVFFENHELQGIFKVNEDGTITFLKGSPSPAIIDNIEVQAKSSDVKLCMLRSECSGNYIFLAPNELISEGNGFALNFLQNNKYFRVLKEESDIQKIDLGDSNNKLGKLSVETKEDLLPLIRSDGFIRIENDDNTLVIDKDEVTKSLFREVYSKDELPLTGSVPSNVIADNDFSKVYSFDENQNLHVQSYETFESQNKKRLQLAADYNLRLDGYFSNPELDLFAKELSTISKQFDVDFKKFVKDGTGLGIVETDRGSVGPDVEASVSPSLPTLIYWSPEERLDNYESGRVVGFSKNIIGSENAQFLSYTETTGHEMGHVLSVLSNPYSLYDIQQDPNLLFAGYFQENWKAKAKEFGIKFDDEVKNENGHLIYGKIISGPEELFPSDYSKTSLGEHQAEIFSTMVHHPEWFTDPNVPEKVRMQRQAFRDLYLNELEKYKKV